MITDEHQPAGTGNLSELTVQRGGPRRMVQFVKGLHGHDYVHRRAHLLGPGGIFEVGQDVGRSTVAAEALARQVVHWRGEVDQLVIPDGATR
jgi:hypothetical protein